MDKNQKELWEERLAEDFSLKGVGYYTLPLHYNYLLYKARERAYKRVIRRYKISIKGARILDIGTGTGFYIDFFKNLGAKHITGMDITEKSIRELTKKYPEFNFMTGNISDPDIGVEGKFDIINAADVIYHVLDDSQFENSIRNIKKLAKPDATIFASDILGKKKFTASEEAKHRSFDEWQYCLTKVGFKIIDVEPVFFLMNNPVDIISNRMNRLMRYYYWKPLENILLKDKKSSHLIGSILYLLDGALTKIFSYSPTSKLLIFKPERISIPVNESHS